MTKQIGIGIIGTGFARRVQVPAFLACEGAFIASVSSGKIENARAAADESGASHFSADWRETVTHPDVDLVCITTPPNLHKEMVIAAAAAGKHILCEKPMAMDVGEAREMVRAGADQGRLMLIDHELRFHPGRQRAYELIRTGAIGKIRHVCSLFQAPHRGDPTSEWNWWSDVAQGGGALGAIGSHVIDQFNWFLGVMPSSVFCKLQTHIKHRADSSGSIKHVTTDDEVHMLLEYAESEFTSDATGLISVSMTDGPEYRNVLELYGSDGAIKINHRGDLWTAGAGTGEWEAVEVELGRQVPGVDDTGFARGFMEFAPLIMEAIRDGKSDIKFAATFEDGLTVQRVLDAARRSHIEQRLVTL